MLDGPSKRGLVEIVNLVLELLEDIHIEVLERHLNAITQSYVVLDMFELVEAEWKG